MTLSEAERPVEVILDNLLYLSAEELADVIRVAQAWQVVSQHFEPFVPNQNRASDDENTR